MLVDSDEELDKVFDDSLRISKVVKPKKILGDKTNLNVNLKEKVKGDLFDSSKLHFSYKIKKEEECIKIDSKEKKDHDNKEMIDQKSDKENNTLLIENNNNVGNNVVNKNIIERNNLEKNIINKTTESLLNPNTEILLTNINQELQGLILNEKKDNDLHALRSPKIKKISFNTTSQFYLREIENEFNKIRESHKKMLMTRNKVLRMVEKEIDCVKREAEKKRKNDLKIKDEEIKQKEDEIKKRNEEIRNLKLKIQELSGSLAPPNLVDNYMNLEIKYSEQTKEIEELRLENFKLKGEVEALNEKYTKLKGHCRENVLRYKDNLDKLYLESLKNIKKKHVH